MATGPEHYLKAEELVGEIERDDGTVDFGDGGEAYVAAAQVHATLALAAAMALGFETSSGPTWSFVASSSSRQPSPGNYEDGA